MPLDVVVIDIRALHLWEPIEKRLIVGFISPLTDWVPFILAVISVPIAFFILDSDALAFSEVFSNTPVAVVKFVASLPRPFVVGLMKAYPEWFLFLIFEGLFKEIFDVIGVIMTVDWSKDIAIGSACCNSIRLVDFGR